jgi:enoyl-CoA hydratase/carnithine racemase
MIHTVAMTDRVTISVDGGVADVRLNRPDKLNAIDPAMFVAMVDAGDALAGDPRIRAVVLSGEGRAFCSGLDFSTFRAMAGGGAGERAEELPPEVLDRLRGLFSDPTGRDPGRITNLAQQAAFTWHELPMPVIAALHGHALGGGLQFALGADIRIVAPDTELSVLEMRWGLIPDMTGLPQLVRLVGLDVAKELTFTGRTISGVEAHDLGIATHVADDPRGAAFDLAQEIAGKSPDAVRAAKRLLNAADQRSLADSFLAESKEIANLVGSANQIEAVTAFFERRAPQFADPTP